ncbi:MAG: helix-turn-helix domain-containing protein [Clostridia bacterium]|nr:helix-turn-helix domain-containing protein [Clostridia bacterium]
MEQKSMGEIISSLRKEKGYTQKELAEKMNVTDKAVSKWERGVACPDVGSLARLAEVLGVSTDVLLNAEHTEKQEKPTAQKVKKALGIALKAVPLAMGVCVLVTSLLGELAAEQGLVLLGIAAVAVGLDRLGDIEK